MNWSRRCVEIACLGDPNRQVDRVGTLAPAPVGGGGEVRTAVEAGIRIGWRRVPAAEAAQVPLVGEGKWRILAGRVDEARRPWH